MNNDANLPPKVQVMRSEEPPFMRQVITTPLHFEVARESLTNLWRSWNGYTVADVLTSIDAEYLALHQYAALTDITPLYKYHISGNEALAWLQRFVTGNLVALATHDVLHVVFCDDHGHVVGDGLLFCLGENDFRLVTEEPHLSWMHDSAIGFQVCIEDISATLAAMSLQGPLSASVLAEAGFSGIDNLPFGRANSFVVGGVPVYVSRNRLWGEHAYDLWMEPGDASPIWMRLLDRGVPFRLRATGFALREVARIEAGLPRAGVDYLSAFAVIDPNNALTPYELGFSDLVDFEAAQFTGRAALRAHAGVTPRRRLVQVAIDWHEPLQFSSIRKASDIVGTVTSAFFSPGLKLNLALVIATPAAFQEGATLHVEAEVREELSLKVVRASARILEN